MGDGNYHRGRKLLCVDLLHPQRHDGHYAGAFFAAMQYFYDFAIAIIPILRRRHESKAAVLFGNRLHPQRCWCYTMQLLAIDFEGTEKRWDE